MKRNTTHLSPHCVIFVLAWHVITPNKSRHLANGCFRGLWPHRQLELNGLDCSGRQLSLSCSGCCTVGRHGCIPECNVQPQFFSIWLMAPTHFPHSNFLQHMLHNQTWIPVFDSVLFSEIKQMFPVWLLCRSLINQELWLKPMRKPSGTSECRWQPV